MYDPYEEYGGHYVYYDNFGFRVPTKTSSTTQKASEEKAIIFLGDSFTLGKQLPYNQLFVSLVSEELNLASLNFGVSSYSPLLYELQTQNIVSQFDADVVILQIYSNDFRGDKSYLEDAVFDGNTIIGIDGGENNLLVKIVRYSYLARLIRKSQLLLQTILSNPNDTVQMSSSAFDFEQNVTDEQMQNTVQIIKRIHTNLTEQGKKLYVFLIPSRSLSLANECCSNDVLYSRLYSELAKIHVDTIDMKSFFEQINNQHELFFQQNIHLTASGHRVLASSIVSQLKNN